MLLIIIHQLMVMMVLVMIGFILFKKKIVSQEGNRSLSLILLSVIVPATIINAYQIEYNAQMAKLLGVAFIASLVTQVLAVVLANIFIKKESREAAINRFSIVYPNSAFIGIPLISAMVGSEGVFFLSAYIAIFNIFMFTHGVIVMKGSLSLENLKAGMLSPVIISTLLAVAMYFLQISLPSVLLQSVGFLASTMTPLAMLVAGFSIAQSDLTKIFGKMSIYLVSFVKSILLPFITLGLLIAFSVDRNVALAILIAVACPSAIANTTMAVKYDRNYIYASEVFTVNTIISLFTIPLVIFIAEMFI